VTGAAQQLSARADAAAKQGNLREAVAALRDLAALEPTADTWLKLGSLLRASGDLHGALDAVHRALEQAPLDFMGLLSRAAILERLGAEDFGEAYGRALAHLPREPLPPALAQTVAHARSCHASYVAKRAAALDGAMAAQLEEASPAIAARIGRFRSNALRQTRPYHSEPTHFHYPGLIEREFHDRADFPWLADLEAATPLIRAEMQAVMASERAELVPYIQYASHEPLAQWAPLNHSRDWTAIHLLQNGRPVEANARHCPATMELLSRLPQPAISGCSPNAMFSLLAPRTSIPPHTGVSNTRLVCHLPLVVPEGCWFRVGAETRHWREGEAFVFDDTIEHEAANPSDVLRVVFIFDVWHPGLAALERDAVRAMLEADASGAALTL
jgi:aspartyl/asparaginyl beta-hydroxylase (cupin superfamily)